MNISLICTASLLFGASVALVTGQETPGGAPPPPPSHGERGPGGPGGGGRPSSTEIAKNLSTRYEAIAVFDTDKNGKLDATEQAAVAKAIDAGTLEVGPPRPPHDKGGKDKAGDKPVANHPPGDKAAEHVAKLYESLVTYDADKNGKLDATEQTAVAKAIDDGTLKLPRPGGPGGGRGGRPGPGRPAPDKE